MPIHTTEVEIIKDGPSTMMTEDTGVDGSIEDAPGTTTNVDCIEDPPSTTIADPSPSVVENEQPGPSTTPQRKRRKKIAPIVRDGIKYYVCPFPSCGKCVNGYYISRVNAYCVSRVSLCYLSRIYIYLYR